MRELLVVLRVARRQWRWMTDGIALGVGVIAANALLMALSGWFIASMAIAGSSGIPFAYFLPAAAVRALAILRSLGRYAERLVTHEAAFRVLADLRAMIGRIEAVFSLFRDSEVTRLNRNGRVTASDDLLDAVTLARRVHGATGGVFDPGVQVLWQALAGGAAPGPLTPLGGLVRDGRDLRLAQGQAVTLNGIAQGIATDRAAARTWRMSAPPCAPDGVPTQMKTTSASGIASA